MVILLVQIFCKCADFKIEQYVTSIVAAKVDEHIGPIGPVGLIN